MSVPNDTPATAILVTFPATISIDCTLIDPSGYAWYYGVVPADVYYLGLKVLFDDVNMDGVKIYSDAGITQATGDLFGDYDDTVQQPVTPGGTYYFQIYPAFAPTGVGTLSIHACPVDAIQIGDLCIPDDEFEFPALVYGADGTLRRSLDLPDCEAADISLSDGFLLIGRQDALNQVIAVELYDDTLTLIASNPAPTGFTVINIVYGQNDLFYLSVPHVGSSAALQKIYTVDKSGVLSAAIATITSLELTRFVPNVAGTIGYYTPQNTSEIKRWNLLTDSAMSDLVATIVGYLPRDFVLLADGTLLMAYARLAAPHDIIVKHYDTAGTTLHTLTFPGDPNVFDHFCRAQDDPISFWLWTETNGLNPDLSIFSRVRISDGTVLETFTKEIFEAGYSTGRPTLEYFGPSASCPVFVFPYGLVSPLVVTCPPDQTAVSVNGQPVAVTWPDPTTTGGTPPIDIVVTPISGSLFAVGTTPVSVVATDADMDTDSCSFTVTVIGPTPFPPATATSTFMRKLRRSPTISQEQMWNFFTRFQLDFQSGGPRDGVDPIEICLRYSDDSGNTWSNEMWLTVDVRGGYDSVAQWFQLGRARDRVWEIYSDSPALTVWLAAYMDVIPGTHG